MKALTTFLALLGLISVSLACNNGDKWCCTNWFGCECVNSKAKHVLGCQKGYHCVLSNGNFRCDKGAHALSARNEVPEIGVADVVDPAPAATTEVATAETDVADECLPGLYCDDNSLMTCTSDHRELFIEDCGSDARCVFDGHAIPRAHCEKKEALAISDIPEPVPETRDTLDTRESDYYCGQCNSLAGKLVNMHAFSCNNAHPTENWRLSACKNEACGLCVTFKERDCQGAITAQPSKGQGYMNVHSAQSYYCY